MTKIVHDNFSKSIVGIFLIWLSISCDKTTDDYNGLFTKNITVDGASRRYAIYIPQNIGTSPAPLFLNLQADRSRLKT